MLLSCHQEQEDSERPGRTNRGIRTGGGSARHLLPFKVLQQAHASATLRLWEARGAGGEGQHFYPRGAVFVWVLRLLRGRPQHCGGSGGGARGLRQEEAESGGLLQGTGEGSSHLLHL